MTTADQSSGVDSGRPIDTQVWLNGDVLACACPDCAAPMSIRLWLKAADCFGCGTSIELTEQQEQEGYRLLCRRKESDPAEIAAALATAVPPAQKREGVGPGATEGVQDGPPPVPEASPPARSGTTPGGPQRPDTTARLQKLYRAGTFAGFRSRFLDDLPAWLVSLIVHLVGMLLLGLWIDRIPREWASITLATAIGYEELEGEEGDQEDSLDDAFEFDAAGVTPLDELTAIESASQAELHLEGAQATVPDPAASWSDLSDSWLTLPTASVGRMYAGRDPASRAATLLREGGTPETEAAVARGLAWLARHQNADGSWSLDAWHKAPGAQGGRDGLGGKSDTAGTALALLPFLGAGETHQRGRYKEEVFKGLRWLVYNQGSDGDLQGPGIGQMYAHGQAAIVLCEAFALTADEQLRTPAQKSLDFIIAAQHSEGGWRYKPGESGDTSVVGWQLMALRSGTMAYLQVPGQTYLHASRFLDSVQTNRYGSSYSYRPDGGSSHVMTAEALLCRQYLGWPRNHPGLVAGVKYLLSRHPPNRLRTDMYYWYYATQVMHHFGGEPWTSWNYKMRPVLLGMQSKKGTMAGSWDPRGGHSHRGGRIYMTALAICTLEIYYRYLPMYTEGAVGQYGAP